MEANIAIPAALIGDPVRAAILLTLLNDRVMPATALAWAAGVSAQSASNHLAKLVAGGLLHVEARGRCRYYRLAGPSVAHALEALALLAPGIAPRDRPQLPKARRLREARSCYDHLAGRFGVALADALEDGGAIELVGEGRYRLTRIGHDQLTRFGIDPGKPDAIVARACIDWTERRRHLAGPLARQLMMHLLAIGWIRRGEESRAIQVTPHGRRGLLAAFGLESVGALAA